MAAHFGQRLQWIHRAGVGGSGVGHIAGHQGSAFTELFELDCPDGAWAGDVGAELGVQRAVVDDQITKPTASTVKLSACTDFFVDFVTFYGIELNLAPSRSGSRES